MKFLKSKSKEWSSGDFHNYRRMAFTLLEVMIATALFFMAIFAILELTTRSLRAARGLQDSLVDAGSLAAAFSQTNQVEEGVVSGDFGDEHPGFQWTQYTEMITTNGLYLVDFQIFRPDGKEDSVLSILLFRPEEANANNRRGGALNRFGNR
jgi:general secretion pathway protein I